MASSLVQENDELSDLTSDEVNALREIVEGTVEGTGEAFFQSLVEHLAKAIQVQYAFVAEFAQVTSGCGRWPIGPRTTSLGTSNSIWQALLARR